MAQRNTKQKDSSTMNWGQPHQPTFLISCLNELTRLRTPAVITFWDGCRLLLHSKAVVRIYGRKGQTQRLITPQPFDSLEAAWPLLRAIIKARLRHGYRVVQPNVYRDW